MSTERLFHASSCIFVCFGGSYQYATGILGQLRKNFRARYVLRFVCFAGCVNNRRLSEQFVVNMVFPLPEAIFLKGGITFLLYFGL